MRDSRQALPQAPIAMRANVASLLGAGSMIRRGLALMSADAAMDSAVRMYGRAQAGLRDTRDVRRTLRRSVAGLRVSRARLDSMGGALGRQCSLGAHLDGATPENTSAIVGRVDLFDVI